MLQYVDVGERSIDAYRGVAPDSILDELVRRAESLRDARVLHVNATAYGGGVSELLRSTVPLLNDLGLIADWKVITGDDAFFQVTKKIHNGLQGADLELTPAEQSTYHKNARANASLLEEEYDFVFIHDPQPAGLLPLRGKRGSRWIWRCHIDTSNPNEAVWDFLETHLWGYDAAIFTMAEFIPPKLSIQRCEIVPPAIDPLSPKNLPLAEGTARQVLEWIGVRLDKPLITQVSRFDPWKDPLGVIAAYQLVRDQLPETCLAMVGSMATDDPEGWDIYREVLAARDADSQIHIFTNLTGVGNIEVNAFQSLSEVVVQKSIREGFGLVVSEALWKGTPLVAGRAGGIPLQMADGVGGTLVESVEDCATAILALLTDSERAKELGRQGRERVREHFLLPRLLLNEVELMKDLAEKRPLTRRPFHEDGRDPVCGMAIAEGARSATLVHQGETFLFCSTACCTRFRDSPERFLSGPKAGA